MVLLPHANLVIAKGRKSQKGSTTISGAADGLESTGLYDGEDQSHTERAQSTHVKTASLFLTHPHLVDMSEQLGYYFSVRIARLQVVFTR